MANDTKVITLDNLSRFKEHIENDISEKQNKLVSGDNIKTINNQSILGSGNITIESGSSVVIKEINEADLNPELLQEVYNEVPEILRVNSANDGIQDYELKVNDKSAGYISYTCIIGGIEIELRLENKDGAIAFSTNQLNFMPSNLVNNLYSAQQVDSLLNNKQDTLISGNNIKTINNESILGNGNLNVDPAGGANLTPLEVPNDYLDLLEFINSAENPETYTISNDNEVHVYIIKENTSEDLYVRKGCIISVYPYSSATILSADGQYVYFVAGEYLTGGVAVNYEDVEYLIDDKIAQDTVTISTDQTITGAKKFESSTGTTFSVGGVYVRFLDSSPAFRVIPDNNGNFNFWYNTTKLAQLNENSTFLYRTLLPSTNTLDLGSSSYPWGTIYATTLRNGNIEKLVNRIVTDDNNILPQTGGILTLGNQTYRWNALYLGSTINFNPQAISKIENLKTLSVNTINLGNQVGSSTTWSDTKFLQYDNTDVKYVGKLYAGLDVNNQPVRNIPDIPDDGTSPINKNYADTNLQEKLVSGTNIKTINNQSILGSGNIDIQGGGSSTDVQINGTSITSNGVANIVTTTAYDAANNHIATMSDIPDVSTKQETLVSGQNIKTINGTSLLGSGDITVSSVGVDKFLSNAQLVSSGSSTTEETVTFSALDTANANFALLSNNRSFWTTYDDYMAAISGSKLEEITLNVGQAGNIRIYGYDTAIPYSQTNNQLASAAASADTNGYLIMTIDADLGISTYKLDGTDSRVTISSQTAIDSCPPCLGFSRTGDTGLMKYNANNITGEPYRHWAHAGLSGTVIETPDPTNALPIVFKILKTSVDLNAKLVFTMNDNTTYEVTLGSVDIAPVLSSVYKGKKLSILGDSISTYQNQIPSGNPTYYPRGDVNSPEKTWWKKLADALGMTILVNNSWSGSMVTTNNGDAGAGCLTRCQSLHSGSTDPDVIIVWLGINDFNNEVALGTYDGKSAVPNTTTTFREAYGMMLNKILTRYKTSEVWVCTLPQMERNNDAGFPEINENNVPLKDFNDAIVELADAFGVKILDHNKAGMTYQNMDTYTVDWDSSTSKGLHPNDAGHSLIANNDIRQMDNAVRKRY